MNYKGCLITVSDISNSRVFYEQLMEQKVQYDFGENVSFQGGFSIHLRSHFAELIDHKIIHTTSNSFELYFEHDDLESLVEKLQKHRVNFVHKLREQPWRQNVVRVYDPDEHIIEIGESMEHLSFRLHQEGLDKDTIAKMINMPLTFVFDSIEKYKNVL